ncbi:hypothetical protein V6N13_093720 [Hibiscus sabdariffa]
MDKVTRLASEKGVVLFSKSSCCMCYAVKILFQELGVTPTVHELDQDPEGWEMEKALMRLGCNGPVPAIFIGGKRKDWIQWNSDYSFGSIVSSMDSEVAEFSMHAYIHMNSVKEGKCRINDKHETHQLSKPIRLISGTLRGRFCCTYSKSPMTTSFNSLVSFPSSDYYFCRPKHQSIPPETQTSTTRLKSGLIMDTSISPCVICPPTFSCLGASWVSQSPSSCFYILSLLSLLYRDGQAEHWLRVIDRKPCQLSEHMKCSLCWRRPLELEVDLLAVSPNKFHRGLIEASEGRPNSETKTVYLLSHLTYVAHSTYTSSMTIASLKQKIIAEWPQDKTVTPKSINDLKLIHAGKVLENNKSLADSRITFGDLPAGVITMHVVVQPAIAKNKTEKSKEDMQKPNSCRSAFVTVITRLTKFCNYTLLISKIRGIRKYIL